jgi:hypothetical protein
MCEGRSETATLESLGLECLGKDLVGELKKEFGTRGNAQVQLLDF